MNWMRSDWFDWLKKAALFGLSYTLARLALTLAGTLFVITPAGWLSDRLYLPYLLLGFAYRHACAELRSLGFKRVTAALPIGVLALLAIYCTGPAAGLSAPLLHFILAYCLFLAGVRAAGFDTNHAGLLRTLRVSTGGLLLALFALRRTATGGSVLPLLAAYTVLALFALALFNLDRHEKSPSALPLVGVRRKWLLNSGLLSLAVAVATGLIYSFFDPALFRTAAALTAVVYSRLIDGFLRLVAPLFMVIDRIISFLFRRILGYTPQAGPEVPSGEYTAIPELEAAVYAGMPVYIRVVVNILLTAAVIAVLVAIIKLALKVSTAGMADAIMEERESVFTWGQVWPGLSPLLKRFRRRTGQARRWANTPAHTVRRWYAELLAAAARAGRDRKPGETAREYGSTMAAALGCPEADGVIEATDLYHLARYNPAAVTQAEAEKARSIATGLLKKS